MKIALYSSIGNDIKSFLSYFHDNLSNRCDLFLNYYGDSDKTFDELKKISNYICRKHTTKFPSLKIAYENSNISEYDYVFVLDDDFIVETGNLLDIPYIMSKYNLDIGSGCHSNFGRVSYPLMRYHEGCHILRITNFIEMNFPVFSQYGLSEYMKVYDGQLYGWGNDWWYLHKLNCNHNKNCGIIDKVCIKNPHHHEKSYNIDQFISRDSRHDQWKKVRHQMNLNEWPIKNIEFIYE